MSKFILIWLSITIFLTMLSFADAQQSRKVSKLGFLSVGPASDNDEVFRQSLRELGYVVGKNIFIEYRWAEGKLDRLAELAAELVKLKVEIIVTVGTPAVVAAKQATGTIPIVTANADNLVEAGLITSLARPGGNITGSTRVDADFTAKRLQVLKEAFPKLSRVAVISHGSLGADQEELQEIQAAARTLGIDIQSLTVQEPGQFLGTYAEITKGHAGALIFFTSAFTSFHRRDLIELAVKNGLPTMCSGINWISVGCLMAYGPNITDLYRRAAVFVDKILKGTKPADLPVERPTKFEFIINLNAAKQLGLTIPPNVLARADRVIR
jgi:putative ABC transport system substrate-binding protein